MIAILVPNLYLKNMGMNLKILNWAPIMMVLTAISSLVYWFLYGKYKIEIEDN